MGVTDLNPEGYFDVVAGDIRPGGVTDRWENRRFVNGDPGTLLGVADCGGCESNVLYKMV